MEIWLVIGLGGSIASLVYLTKSARRGTLWSRWFGHVDENTSPGTFWLVWMFSVIVAILGVACFLFLLAKRVVWYDGR